jgi:hypothetical protein
MVKEERGRVGDEEDELEWRERTGFRGEVALLIYMGQDRPALFAILLAPTVGFDIILLIWLVVNCKSERSCPI